MSELHTKSRSRGSSLFWPTYMLSWALLAGGALTYLSLSSFQTNGAEGSRATPPQSTPESNRAELDRAMLTAQVRELNKTVSSLRTRMAKLKTAQQTASGNDVVANQAPSTALTAPSTAPNTSAITTSSIARPDTAPLTVASDGEMTRLTESKAPSPAATTVKTAASAQPRQPELLNSTTTTSSAGTEPARAEAPATAEGKPNRRRNLATSPLRPGRVPPLPPFNTQKTSQHPSINNTRESAAVNSLQPKLLNSATDSIRTASLPVPTSLKPQQPAPIAKTTPARPFAFGKPTVTQRQVNASAAALSLSTAQSVTGLRASWLLLTSRHPATFVGYQPRYIADQANGTYRLIAGPIANHAEADRICNELRAQHVNCGVTSYVGSSLK